jgi:hypothetical protein
MAKNKTDKVRGSTTSGTGTYAEPSWDDLRRSAEKEKDKNIKAARLAELRRDRADAGSQPYYKYSQAKTNKLANKDYLTNDAINEINRMAGREAIKPKAVKKMAKGGSVASKRGDGCATKGKTKGRFV